VCVCNFKCQTNKMTYVSN